MSVSNIVGWACCAVIVCLVANVSGMNNEENNDKDINAKVSTGSLENVDANRIIRG